MPRLNSTKIIHQAKEDVSERTFRNSLSYFGCRNFYLEDLENCKRLDTICLLGLFIIK